MSAIAAEHGYRAASEDVLADEPIPDRREQPAPSAASGAPLRHHREDRGRRHRVREGRCRRRRVRSGGVQVGGRAAGCVGATVSGRFSVSDRSEYGAVRASYWDPGQARLVHVKAGAGEPVSDLPDARPDRVQAEAMPARLRALTRRTATLELTMSGDPAVIANLFCADLR